MGITIKQIATLAGVSRGTVDRALNNRGGVNREVAANILAIAKENGYTPNLAGKALSLQNKTTKIVVILNSAQNPFFAQMLKGIQKIAREIAHLGFVVECKEISHFDVQKQLELLNQAQQEGVCYIALMPINAPQIYEKLCEMAKQSIHILTLNNDMDFPQKVAYVGCNYEKSGQTAAGLLGMITGGCAQVGIVTGSTQVSGHNLRILGFQHVLQNEFPHIKVLEITENQDNDLLSYEMVTNLLRKHPKLNALYFTAGGTRGGIQAVCDLKRNGQIKIITFDTNDKIKKWLQEDVVAATICQQPFEQGYKGVQVLYELAMYRKKPKNTTVHTEIQIVTKYNL